MCDESKRLHYGTASLLRADDMRFSNDLLLAGYLTLLNGLSEEVIQAHNFWTVFDLHAFVLILFIYVLVARK